MAAGEQPEATYEQFYMAMSAAAKAVTSYAAFVELAETIGGLSHGDVDKLWDAWCI